MKLTALHSAPTPTTLNDVHARLTPTPVADLVAVDGPDTIRAALDRARRDGRRVSVSGARYAMGAQPFRRDSVHLQTSAMDRVLGGDSERGWITVQAGAHWPSVIAATRTLGGAPPHGWAIAQKQTGADRLSLGGAVSANVHGRGLRLGPLVDQIEALEVVTPDGELRRVDRASDGALFRHVVGGYGGFGVVHAVTLRLVPRRKVQRRVVLSSVECVVDELEAEAQEGALYGDFQFAIDPADAGFLRRGIRSTYHPVEPDRVIPVGQHALSKGDWMQLLYLAHSAPGRAFERYAAHYLSTDGFLYWSDTHQLGVYVTDYHRELDRQLGLEHPHTEVITELFVPRSRLVSLFDAVRDDFRDHRVPVVYGTVRLIQREAESALPWAREDWACVIFNLCVEHTEPGLERARSDFRRLIDRALELDGSYYLTYHRWARDEQLLAAHPALPDVVAEQQRRDPQGLLVSDWWAHMRRAVGACSDR
ncbi:MAG: FAD-binding protein [Planctomycetota bacterium]